MAADLKASVVPPVSRSPKMCFISPRHNKSGVSPSGPLFIAMKVINLVWSDTTFVLLLYTLDNKWSPRIFTQSTALFDSTLPTFPTLGARLWTPSPGSHNNPHKKQEAGVLLEFHLYCIWAFFIPIVVINLVIWQHFCSLVIHAGQRMVSTHFHTVDCPLTFLLVVPTRSWGTALDTIAMITYHHKFGNWRISCYFLSQNMVTSNTTRPTPKIPTFTTCSLSHCLLTTVAFIALRKGYAKKLLPTSPTCMWFIHPHK